MHDLQNDHALRQRLRELLMGERHVPGRMRNAPPELWSALSFDQYRLRQAEARADAAEALEEGTATSAPPRMPVRHERGPSARGADGTGHLAIKRRREALEAERAELEAEITSLSTADNIARAIEAEEGQGARRRSASVRTRPARLLRPRVTAFGGLEPTAASRGSARNLSMKPNGDRDVSQSTAPPTPEEIARGDVEGDAA